MVKQNEKVKKTSSKNTKGVVKKEEKVEKEETLDEFDDEEFADIKRSSNIEKTPLEKELLLIRRISIASLVVSIAALILLLLMFAKISDNSDKDLSRVTDTSTSGSNDSNGSNVGSSSEEEVPTEYDVSMFNKISFDDFKDMLEDGDKKVRFVFTGRSNCTFFLRFLPSLQKSVEEYDYQLDYLDMITVYDTQASTYSKEDDETLEEIRDMDSHFTDQNTYLGSTPMVYVVQNGKVIDVHAGYTEYEDYASFLEEHDVKKK